MSYPCIPAHNLAILPIVFKKIIFVTNIQIGCASTHVGLTVDAQVSMAVDAQMGVAVAAQVGVPVVAQCCCGSGCASRCAVRCKWVWQWLRKCV